MKKLPFLIQWSCTLLLLLFAVEVLAQRYTGRASFYADRFHKRRTASGALYYKDSMTCAHRTLPFGTYERVTNQNNGKSVILEVTDRGPFIKGRIIDLSSAAAKKLVFIAAGTAPVVVEVVPGPEEPAPAPVVPADSTVLAEEVDDEEESLPIQPLLPADSNFGNNREATVDRSRMDKTRRKGYGVQLGSFEQMDNALKLLVQLQQDGFDEAYVFEDNFNGVPRYRLLVGALEDRSGAVQLKEQLNRKGYLGFIVNP